MICSNMKWTKVHQYQMEQFQACIDRTFGHGRLEYESQFLKSATITCLSEIQIAPLTIDIHFCVQKINLLTFESLRKCMIKFEMIPGTISAFSTTLDTKSILSFGLCSELGQENELTPGFDQLVKSAFSMNTYLTH